MRPRAQPQEYGHGTKAADISNRGHGHGPGIMAPGCGHKAKRCVLAHAFSSDLTLPDLCSHRTQEHGSAAASIAARVRPRDEGRGYKRPRPWPRLRDYGPGMRTRGGKMCPPQECVLLENMDGRRSFQGGGLWSRWQGTRGGRREQAARGTEDIGDRRAG